MHSGKIRGLKAPAAHVTVKATTDVVLAANTARSHAILRNISNEEMFWNFGSDAIQDKGPPIKPGDMLVIDSEFYTTAAVHMICASGGKSLAVWEA